MTNSSLDNHYLFWKNNLKFADSKRWLQINLEIWNMQWLSKLFSFICGNIMIKSTQFQNFWSDAATWILSDIQIGLWSSDFGPRKLLVNGRRIKRQMRWLIGTKQNIQHFDDGKKLSANIFTSCSEPRRMTVDLLFDS